MTIQSLPGTALWPDSLSASPDHGLNSISLDLSTEQFAMMGRARWYDTDATKSLVAIHQHFIGGTVTGAGVLECARQGTTNVQPFRPDGVVSQVSSLAAGASPTAGTFTRFLFDTPVSVAQREKVAFVFRFSTFVAGSTVSLGVQVHNAPGGPYRNRSGVVRSADSGGTWAIFGSTSSIPVTVLEFSDGTYGMLEGAAPGWPGQDLITAGVNSSLGFSFTPSSDFPVDGVWCDLQLATAPAAVECRLYADLVLQETVTLTTDDIFATVVGRVEFPFASQRIFEQGVRYTILMHPTVGVFRMGRYNYTQAGMRRNVHPLALDPRLATRTLGGVWLAESTLAQLRLGLIVGVFAGYSADPLSTWSVVDDVFHYITEHGIAGESTDWALLRRRMMDAPVSDQLVVVAEDGGNLPEIADGAGIGDSAMQDVGVLITVRGAAWDSDASLTKAQEILTSLHGLRSTVLGSSGGPLYLRVRAMTSEPVFAGYDDTGRPRHTIALRLLRAQLQ